MCLFFSSRRRHTRLQGDWSSDVCSSDLTEVHLHQEGPVAGELQYLMIVLPVSGNPHVVVVVDEDPVLVLGPVEAGARAAPALHEVPGLVELDHRRGGEATVRAPGGRTRFGLGEAG